MGLSYGDIACRNIMIRDGIDDCSEDSVEDFVVLIAPSHAKHKADCSDRKRFTRRQMDLYNLEMIKEEMADNLGYERVYIEKGNRRYMFRIPFEVAQSRRVVQDIPISGFKGYSLMIRLNK